MFSFPSASKYCIYMARQGLILHPKPTLPKSTSQALPPLQIKPKQYWLSSFWAQVINPASEILSRALSGGKEMSLSLLLSETDAHG